MLFLLYFRASLTSRYGRCRGILWDAPVKVKPSCRRPAGPEVLSLPALPALSPPKGAPSKGQRASCRRPEGP